jgi:hypothetical protein
MDITQILEQLKSERDRLNDIADLNLWTTRLKNDSTLIRSLLFRGSSERFAALSC